MRDVPLGDILVLIAARAGVGIAAVGYLDARVDASLDGLDAESVIRWLAHGVLKEDPDPRVWLAATRALSVLPDAAARDALRLASQDRDVAVRREAILGLGEPRSSPR